jgi:hypothetical protein
MTDQVLHLVVPGLLGPLPRRCQSHPALQQRFPIIERWLARADRCAVPVDPDRLLFRLFAADVPQDGDLPTAPLCFLADSGERFAGGAIFHAEPVHLRPDQDRLLLFDLPADSLDAAQAAAFVAAFNDHFADDGWRLCAPTPGRWFLQVAQPPRDLHTRPLGEVIGRNVDLFLPTGVDAGSWRRRLTEVQMLFHGLAVNHQREAQGRPTVNGLWLHGGGRSVVHPRRALRLDDGAPPLARGLASVADGAPVARLRWLGRAQRAVWDGDVEGWRQAVSEVEDYLAASDGELWLYPGDGHGYCYHGAHRWRLWRRRRPLRERLLPVGMA